VLIGGVIMVNFSIKGDKNHLRIFSLVLFIIGLILLLFPGIIGFLGIRLAAVLLVAFCIISFYVSSDSTAGLNRMYLIGGMIGGIIVFIFPSLVMVFTGIGILTYGIYTLYNIVKFKSYNDKTYLVLGVVASLLGLYFIFNGGGAIKQIIRILGVGSVAISCVLFYKSLEN